MTTAEYVVGLPPRLLSAISLTETGRPDPVSGRVRPWPWTINAEGQGAFFDTRQHAIDAVRALQARGVRSIDVGCLQVNLQYHPDAFASLQQAFDPRTNAVYAARFLATLHADGGAPPHDWARAIAAYHSETPALGQAYHVLVIARWQRSEAPPAAPRQSAYADFAGTNSVAGRAYRAFLPSGMVYQAFGDPAVGHQPR